MQYWFFTLFKLNKMNRMTMNWNIKFIVMYVHVKNDLNFFFSINSKVLFFFWFSKWSWILNGNFHLPDSCILSIPSFRFNTFFCMWRERKKKSNKFLQHLIKILLITFLFVALLLVLMLTADIDWSDSCSPSFL